MIIGCLFVVVRISSGPLRSTTIGHTLSATRSRKFWIQRHEEATKPCDGYVQGVDSSACQTRQKVEMVGWVGKSKSPPFTTFLQFVQEYFQIFVFMVFASIALYYAGSFFKLNLTLFIH